MIRCMTLFLVLLLIAPAEGIQLNHSTEPTEHAPPGESRSGLDLIKLILDEHDQSVHSLPAKTKDDHSEPLEIDTPISVLKSARTPPSTLPEDERTSAERDAADVVVEKPEHVAQLETLASETQSPQMQASDTVVDIETESQVAAAPVAARPSDSKHCAESAVPSHNIVDFVRTKWVGGGLMAVLILNIATQSYLLYGYLTESSNIVIERRSPMLVTIHVVLGTLMSVLVYTLACVGFNVAHKHDNFAVVMRFCIWTQSFFSPMLAVATISRVLRLRAMARHNEEKPAAAELMPLHSSRSDSSYSNGLDLFMMEGKMIRIRSELSERRYSHFAGALGFVVFLYSTLFYLFALGKCEVDVIQSYNAVSMCLLSMLAMGIWCCMMLWSSGDTNGALEAFEVRDELTGMIIAHMLLGGAQLAAFAIFAMPGLVGDQGFAIAYVVWAYIGVLWPLLVSYTQLYRPLALHEGIERYRSKISKNESAFQKAFTLKEYRERFFQYLDLEFSTELWLFWTDVERFRSLGESATAGTSLSEAARVLFNKYARPGAALDVELDRDLQLESSWNMHTMSSDATMFDAAQNAVYVKMLCAFPRYLHFKFLHPDVLPEPVSSEMRPPDKALPTVQKIVDIQDVPKSAAVQVRPVSDPAPASHPQREEPHKPLLESDTGDA